MTRKSSSLKLHTAATGTAKQESSLQVTNSDEKHKTTVLTEVWKTFIKSKLRLCTCSTSEALRLRAQYNSFSEMPLHVESCYPDTHLSLHHRQWLVTEVVLRNPNQQSLLVKHMLLHYALQPTYSFLYKSAVCPNEKKKHCVLSQVVTAQTQQIVEGLQVAKVLC